MKEIKTIRIEEEVSHIGAKVANAVEQTKQVKVLLANTEAMLIGIQQDVEDLYVLLDDSDHTE